MKYKDPINTIKSKKYKKEKFAIDSSMLISIEAYKSSFNKTKPFFKPI